jgi:hypothetical protein
MYTARSLAGNIFYGGNVSGLTVETEEKSDQKKKETTLCSAKAG